MARAWQLAAAVALLAALFAAAGLAPGAALAPAPAPPPPSPLWASVQRHLDAARALLAYHAPTAPAPAARAGDRLAALLGDLGGGGFPFDAALACAADAAPRLAVDLVEQPDGSLDVRVDAPGVDAADLAVEVVDAAAPGAPALLVITARKAGGAEGAGGTAFARERWAGTATRAVPLPPQFDADALAVAPAGLQRGVLHLVAPRKAAGALAPPPRRVVF